MLHQSINPQAAALHAVADVADWTRCKAVLTDIIARCAAVEPRLTATDAFTSNQLAQVRRWKGRAERVLNDPLSPPMADCHLVVFGPNGHGPQIDTVIRFAEMTAAENAA